MLRIPIKFTLDDLLDTLGPALYDAGMACVESDLVSGFHHDGAVIHASVRDIDGERQTQVVELAQDDGVLLVNGVCTCATVHNCGHVAAVLIEHLRLAQKHWGTVSAAAAPARVRPGVPAAALPASPRELSQLGKAPPARSGARADRLCFVLLPDAHLGAVALLACRARSHMNGRAIEAAPICAPQQFLAAPPFRLEADDPALMARYIAIESTPQHEQPRLVRGRDGARLLQALLAKDKLAWAASPLALRMDLLPPLHPGPPRRAALAWQIQKESLRLAWEFAAEAGARPATIELVVPTEPPHYVHQQLCGEMIAALDAGVPLASMLALVARLPALDCKNAATLLQRLCADGLGAILPVPDAQQEAILYAARIKTELLLGCVVQRFDAQGMALEFPVSHDYAMLVVTYDGQPVTAGMPDPAGAGHALPAWIAALLRHNDPVHHAMRQLGQAGFHAPAPHDTALQGIRGALVLAGGSDWIRFAKNTLPQLEQAGWHIKKMRQYRYDVVAVDDWYANLDENGGNAWFDLDLGIIVAQKRIALLPLLVELIRSTPRAFEPQLLAGHADDDEMMLALPDGMRVALPWGRIKLILGTLGELYFGACSGAAMRLSTLDAARLAELDAHDGLRWLGGARLAATSARLGNFGGIRAVAAPAGLQASLRDYQGEGLSWLQFLREYNLAGILADDMGLGKTIQTLAHILVEKEAGRLDRPALVVAPTSLMGNWQDEAARFAPSLRVLLLHGAERLERFERMDAYDLVLTTYALLPRDEEPLRRQQFHLLILDEAQYIKNPRSKATQTAGLLQARHRLCLTGTPLENHLGELWSQFHFLLPGLLGREKDFNRDFRLPIEKSGDAGRADFLRRRLKPFMLRRTKDTVARELPPKTEMLRSIELSGAQRDLYETMRVAMDKKVSAAIRSKGVGRSHIIILEALLKLRQICCDPRLLKSELAAGGSAKLAELLEMLDELLGEERKILIFSQFTSMLALIETELKARNIGYALLTGDTRDRAGAVRSFQQGEVPVFLISLKAGGVGLNLTAADTVIHYDPWWNPAAENQATDRAWRIGQDKPVFVYKLIARGTLEEKIQMLQQKKAALAGAVLSGGDAHEAGQLSQEDLRAIFAPLPA